MLFLKKLANFYKQKLAIIEPLVIKATRFMGKDF